jgi:hypothetical protein
MRGRNRRNHNPLTRVYESNGPDVKIRGTAHHIAEKYVQLARDAQASGDPVAAESYLQHAEHYFRLIAAAHAQFAQQNPHHQQPQQPFQRSDLDPRDDFDDEGEEIGPEVAQQNPAVPGAPQPYYQPPQQQPQQQYRPPQPQNQPAPPFQQQPRRPDDGEPGLPAFITGGGQAPAGNGYDAEPSGDREQRHDRFGRRRRRFRHRGPGDFEPRGDRPDYQAQAPAPATPAPEAGGEVETPKPAGPGE